MDSFKLIKLYCTFTVRTILNKSIFALAVVRSIYILALRVGNSITRVDWCSALVDFWHKRMQYYGKMASQTSTVRRACNLLTRDTSVEGLSD